MSEKGVDERQALANLPCPGGYEYEFTSGTANAAGSTSECDYCPALRFTPSWPWGVGRRRPWDPAKHGEPPEYRGARTHVSAFECQRCGAVVYDREVHNWWHGAGRQQ